MSRGTDIKLISMEDNILNLDFIIGGETTSESESEGSDYGIKTTKHQKSIQN